MATAEEDRSVPHNHNIVGLGVGPQLFPNDAITGRFYAVPHGSIPSVSGGVAALTEVPAKNDTIVLWNANFTIIYVENEPVWKGPGKDDVSTVYNCYIRKV